MFGDDVCDQAVYVGKIAYGIKRDRSEFTAVREQIIFFGISDHDLADLRLADIGIGQSAREIDAAAGEKRRVEMIVLQCLRGGFPDKGEAVFAQFSADAIDLAVGRLGEQQRRLRAVRHEFHVFLSLEIGDHERSCRGGVQKHGIAVAHEVRGGFADLPLCLGIRSFADKKGDLAVKPLVEYGAAVGVTFYRAL